MIYKIGGLIAALAIVVSCSNSKVMDTTSFVSYGPTKVTVTDAIPVTAMVADYEMKGVKRASYTIAASLEEICAKAGCWVNIKNGNDELMVRFKDHFTIPVDTKLGTKAFMHGDLYADTVSVDLLRHFAEDAGKSEAEIMKITEPKITLSFEADGITFLPAKKKA